jgi:hypothetical protein
MGATDVKAIENSRQPAKINTKIKESYDTKRTRLHAKTMCSTDTGFTTAIFGSSTFPMQPFQWLEVEREVTKKDLPENHRQIAVEQRFRDVIPDVSFAGGKQLS